MKKVKGPAFRFAIGRGQPPNQRRGKLSPMPEPSQSEQKKCFVIAPIGDKDSPTRKRSDAVLEHVFKKALSPEYCVKRADEISEPGMITSQILQAIQDYDLVLADLTEHNPNVFYELAVRHAIDKPIIHVIDTHFGIPFDVAGFRTIKFDFTDLNSVAEAIKQIGDQASEVSKGNWGGTPIKIANLMRRTQGESQQTLLLQETLQSIAATRQDLEGWMAYLAEKIEKLESGTRDPYLFGTVPLSSLSGVPGIPSGIPVRNRNALAGLYPPVMPVSSPQSIPSEADAPKSVADETGKDDHLPVRERKMREAGGRGRK